MKGGLLARTAGAVRAYVAWGYVLLLTCVYPFVYHNNYIDISGTKYTFFLQTTALYAAVCLLADIFARRKPRLEAIGLCFLGFLLAQWLSAALCEDFSAAFTGAEGRRSGLLYMLAVAGLVYIAAGSLAKPAWALYAALAAGGLCCLLGVANFFGLDPLRMYKNLVLREHEMFLSTIGNRNFFGAYACLIFAAGGAAFLYAPRRWALGPLGLLVAVAFAAIVACRSDLALFGAAAALAALFVFAADDSFRLARLLWIVALTGLAAGALAALYARYGGQCLPVPADCLAGGMLSNLYGWALGPLVALAAFPVLRYRLRFSRRAALLFVAALALTLVAAVGWFTVFDRQTPLAGPLGLLRIDDEWGNHRGYVWARSLARFGSYPFAQKLFGYGPELFLRATAQYREEMIRVTLGVYDNAHNEYLQYLLTTGLVGLGCYLGALVCALIRAFKRGGRRGAVVFAGILAYCAQALFNVNQPATTPYLFLLLALAAGEK